MENAHDYVIGFASQPFLSILNHTTNAFDLDFARPNIGY